MMEARVTHQDATPVMTTHALDVLQPRLITGLTWEVATTPETPVIQKDAPPVLRLPTRRAVLPEGAATPDSDSRPATALLLAMAADLLARTPEHSGPWAFLAELESGLWLALADIAPCEDDTTLDSVARVSPRPGPEQLFDNPEATLAALQDHLETTDLAGLAVTWVPQDAPARLTILSGLAHIAPTLPVEEVSPTGSEGADAAPLLALGAFPVFLPPRRVPVRLIGGAGAGLSLLLAGVFIIAPLLEDMLTPPPPPPPQMVEVDLAPGAFATACTDALTVWWPRVVGWRVETTGCALPRHLPEKPDLTLPPPEAEAPPTVPLTVWRHLLPERGRNRVLADAAAAQAIDTWRAQGRDARLEAGTLTFWTTYPLPLVTGQEARPAGQDAADRLAALWADTPGAVTEDTGANVRSGADGHSGLITIATGTTPLPTLFSRTVPGLAPVRLVQDASGDDGTLVLAPPQPRTVLADRVQSGASGHSGDRVRSGDLLTKDPSP